eukprot:Plantae.Rhodophyta-Hildenbrandia_rubra.ctg15088.p1 GENE.Plantae.Rhodophyta-Hildenbrandia_rubra.ctg15088~~Plantae.Rhodophyta-Hildenbrandia_rubra.ctg15088.p1  ORF type:complete len:532 (-),score=51.13 Plantae.Rhodophyta-Hildenbrandia_rubra.ctg15088:1287-2882(-)
MGMRESLLFSGVPCPVSVVSFLGKQVQKCLSPLHYRRQSTLPNLRMGDTSSQPLLEESQFKIESPPSVKQPLLPSVPPFLAAAFAGCLFGFDIGTTSGALPLLSTAFGDLSAWSIGFIASASLIGAFCSSAAVFRFKGGRLTELRLAAALFPLGTLIQVYSNSFASICLGRLIYGTAIGIAMHAGPLYISETSPVNVRGLFVSLKEAAIVGGILLGYVFSELNADSWRAILGSPGVIEIPLALLVLSPLVPESPRWLASQAARERVSGNIAKADAFDDHADAAARTLRSVPVLEESRLYYTSLQETAGQQTVSFLDFVKTDTAAQRALLVGLGLVALQQVSGQPSVLYFATTLFKRAGLGGSATTILGSWKLACTFLGASLVDRSGRRALLTTGTLMMMTSLGLLSFLYFVSPDGTAAPTAALLSTLLYVGGYQVGFGPVTWLLLSEIMPMEIRTTGVAVCVLSNFAFNVGVTSSFEVIREAVGTGALFGLFCVVTVGALVFIQALVPETKDLSLEDINKMLSGRPPTSND